jgi:hypothetical protein
MSREAEFRSGRALVGRKAGRGDSIGAHGFGAQKNCISKLVCSLPPGDISRTICPLVHVPNVPVDGARLKRADLRTTAHTADHSAFLYRVL